MLTHYDWQTVYKELQDCRRCGLCDARTNVVIGEGNPSSSVMFVGEGPGKDEDASGRPFVGRAGQLLDKMLASINLNRDKVYIANVVKCRPPNNRTPSEDEAKACLPFLRAQFALVRPRIMVCLGATASRFLYDPAIRITRDRGVWKCTKGVWLLPTYHPAALLRDPAKKREAWEDLKSLQEKMVELGLDT